MYQFAASRRGLRALTLVLSALSTAITACGGDDGGGLTGLPKDPPGEPSDPGNGGGGGGTGPAPVGTVMYAVDLSNNFLVFGTGSIATLTAKMRIHGLPLLKRVIGLAVRPSDGAL